MNGKNGLEMIKIRLMANTYNMNNGNGTVMNKIWLMAVLKNIYTSYLMLVPMTGLMMNKILMFI